MAAQERREVRRSTPQRNTTHLAPRRLAFLFRPHAREQVPAHLLLPKEGQPQRRAYPRRIVQQQCSGVAVELQWTKLQ
jgi:hypothetical protein